MAVMAYRLDKLIPCGTVKGRLIWHYQNLADPVRVMTEAGYFPKSLELEEIIPAARGVFLIQKLDRMLETLEKTLDGIADTVLDD